MAWQDQTGAIHVEVDEVETPDGRAFSVFGRIDGSTVIVDHLTEIFTDPTIEPRDVVGEELDSLRQMHGAQFKAALIDKGEADGERSYMRMQGHE